MQICDTWWWKTFVNGLEVQKSFNFYLNWIKLYGWLKMNMMIKNWEFRKYDSKSMASNNTNAMMKIYFFKCNFHHPPLCILKFQCWSSVICISKFWIAFVAYFVFLFEMKHTRGIKVYLCVGLDPMTHSISNLI